MTKLLEQAFTEAGKLPETEQDAVAQWLLEEIESERRWQDSFSRSGDLLHRLADEALVEHLRGETEDLSIQINCEIQDHQEISIRLQDLPESVQRQARAAYQLFKNNPYHPSLNFKQVDSRQRVYSVRISLHYRALGRWVGDEVIWFWIGPHAEYDKILSEN